MQQILNGFIGVFALIVILYLLSENRKRVNWRTIGMALALQLTFAFLVIKISWVRTGFEHVSGFFVTLLSFTKAGSTFLFGSLVTQIDSFGFIFVFQVLPTIVFFAALTAMLYYFGILQRIVYVFAWIMNRLMRLSGAESLAASANVFLGQTEAPLLIKPYLDKMTRSEIMALMTGGMATIAGSVLAAYIGFLGGNDPVQQQIFATHLLSASIMAAPGSLLAAKLLVPETENYEKELSIGKESIGDNVLEAISNGTSDGLRLAVNVGAMLLVFTAIMAMFNYIFKNWIGGPTGLNEIIVQATDGKFDGLTLQYLLGYMFAPVAWLIGVRGEDVVLIGQLLGEKTVLNEFIAFTSLADFKAASTLTNPRSVIIATYALCGFANFASIGIQIGGIGALAPGRRTLLSQLGVKALIGGTAASLLNGAIAGMLIE
jgi:concentrative nucleoside transporter, CNT family